MAYNIELEDGGKIVLLYAKNFTWKDTKQSKLLDNQPLTGRVYRAFRAPGSDALYIKLFIDPTGKPTPIMDGVRITSLNYNTPEWDCEFIEINDDNLLDLDIQTDDYRQITEWSETNHDDFVKLIYGEEGLDVAVSSDDEVAEAEQGTIEEKIMKWEEEGEDISEDKIKEIVMNMFEQSITPYTAQLDVNMKYLSMRDPFALKALNTLTAFMVENSKEEDKGDTVSLEREISFSDEYGKGANIYGAIYNMDKYINRKGTKEDLLNAAKSILFELIRLDMSNKNKSK